MTNYEAPVISIDVVPVQLQEDGTFSVFLGKRLYEPFKGEYALPGVLLTPHERVNEAAYRALTEKVNITSDQVTHFVNVGAFDNPDRDPRGATVSITLLAVIKSEHEQELSDSHITKSITELVEPATFVLPFDHNNIVLEAFKNIQSSFNHQKDITRAFLGDVFSTQKLTNALNVLQDEETRQDESTNIARSLRKSGWVEQVEAPATEGKKRGRPALHWGWL